MNLVIDSDVSLEIYQATNYIQENSGKGCVFQQAINQALDVIQEDPYLYQLDEDIRCRRCTINKFRYFLFYRVKKAEQIIHVIALAHQSRKPYYWLNDDK